MNQKESTHSTLDVGPWLQVGEALIDKGYITAKQLDEALEHQAQKGHKKLLGEVLVDLNFVTDEQVIEVLAEGYGVPFVTQAAKIADPKVVELLPREFLEEHSLLPLFLVRDVLTVAVSEPANLFLVEEIQRLTGHEVQIVATTTAEIEASLQAYLPAANVFVIDDIYEDIDDADFSIIEKQVTELADLEEVAGRSPVVKLVNYLIFSAVQDGASDIHIEPDDHRLRVRYRVDGRLFEKLMPPYQMHAAITSRIKIMSNLDISERRLPQDGDIHTLMEGRPIDLRVSTMPGKFGEKVVIRIIDHRTSIVSLDKLGFSRQMFEAWKELVRQPNGVVLVTGPTGSGKSTTLYSVLSLLNSDELNISTVEDPIEASIPGINQTQVNEKAGFTFAAAMRSMLRQDPDIMMVGEIRDGETASVTTQAALTGHLAFSTLHTNDAPSAVTRLINLGVEPYLVAATLRGVLAQRLVRKICPHCKESYEPEQAIREAVEHYCGTVECLYRGQGCTRCRGTGFAGRIGIFELMIPDEILLAAVARGASLQELREMLAKNGFVTLRADGMEKVQGGLTTAEEVFYVTSM
ncbi:MAG: GspE/PulE family protein [Planctomycetota bacterium]|nr:GspE/PulE family protein [Planctomycetota bacterium]MCZ6611640.1 GspE/PulE family protein [Planctomycetota bacterium]